MNEQAFDNVWRQQIDFKFETAGDEEALCPYAHHYMTWAEALYQEELRSPTLIGINQKVLMLTKKYFEWRVAVPKAHRERIAERGHVCIFHIFERLFWRLKALELGLQPPMLFLPPPPAPPVAPVVQTIAGITLGEVLGDEL